MGSFDSHIHTHTRVNRAEKGRTFCCFARRPDLDCVRRPARRPAVRVNVRISMGLRVDAYTRRAGQVLRFRGRACPSHSGLAVAIPRRGTGLRTCSAYSPAFRI